MILKFAQSLRFNLGMISDRARCLPFACNRDNCKEAKSCTTTWVLVFLLKWIDDFSRFSSWPNHCIFVSKQTLITSTSWGVAFANKKVNNLGKKKRWVIIDKLDLTFNHFKTPFLFLCSHTRESISDTRINRNGDNESPWCKPGNGEKYMYGLSLTKIENLEAEIHKWTRYT